MIRTEIYSKFLQIVIREDYSDLNKIIEHAKRYFSQIHKLSNTLLILDDSKRMKKQYFLNWLAHLQECGEEARLLLYAHLPIRIKIMRSSCMTYRIDAKARVISHDRVRILLSKYDMRARRYVLHLFSHYVCDQHEILLDSSKDGFWEHFMGLIQSRVMGNLVLNLDFQDRDYLTQSEQELEDCHLILNSKVGDDLLEIRKKYLHLAKKYHPDNVFGADIKVLQDYKQKFVQIQNAFETICERLG